MTRTGEPRAGASRLSAMGAPRIALVVSLLLTACGSSEGGEVGTSTPLPTTTVVVSPENSPVEQLERARRLWAAAGPDQYRFLYQDDCGECSAANSLPRTVVVWDGEPTASRHPTIDDLFSLIENAITQSRSVEVAYDLELGHPEEISIDMHTRPVDGGTHLLVSELESGLPGQRISLADLEAATARWETNRPAAYQFTTTIGCDCSLAGEIHARVDGQRLVDWDVVFDEGEGGDLSAITVDQMLNDIHTMLSWTEGVVEEGVRFTGSAEYHPDLGYPIWVGLDIEILDPDSELAHLPPRLVFAVDHLEPLEEPDSSDVDNARRSWADEGFSGYRYEMTIHDIETASFSTPYLVTVLEGEVVEVYRDGVAVAEVDAPTLPIEGLFDLIEVRTAEGFTVDTIYHQRLGHPVLIVVRQPDSSATESLVSISGLERIERG